jgi:phage terminase large subunit-like protein
LLSAGERQTSLKRVLRSKRDKLDFLFKWTINLRDEQMPPADKDWIVWLVLAGRGFGKTRTGAETVLAEIKGRRAKRVALVAPTAADARAVMVEGESGILTVAHPNERPVYEPSKRQLIWKNGAIATCYSADQPQRLRGPQHDFAWADEISAWRRPQQAWDMLMLGLRLGGRPRAVVTTTPKPIKLLRDLIAARTTRVTRGSTYANRGHLATTFLSAIARQYEGTRLGRQEIHAELLEQAEGALWSRAGLEAAQVAFADIPEPKRTVVAIDPAVTANKNSDETGIVVALLGIDGLVYILRDASGHFTADEWARRAIGLCGQFGADRVVGETNNGGDLIEVVLRTVDPNIAYKAVTASRGKQTRAEPVAALYEQRRVRHAPGLGALEDQMCNWTPGSGDGSPDRVDALVWAVTELVLQAQTTGALDFYAGRAARANADQPS